MSSLYKKYDLVWEMDGKLVGYKAVVDCVDVSLVPEDLHRHLVRDSTAEYLQPLPALKRNYDLLWEGAGGMEGFNAVVSSRVDLGKLPMILTAHVVPQSDALPRPTFHSWDSANPLYSKTSQLIGHKIEQTKAPHSDETQSWHGLSGKFTSHFPDPGRYGGLNCSMNKNAVTKGPSFGTTPYYEARAT
eukprot:TRINITY_DN3883_c0_g4_i1.p1 TRINITY_DN3883_c0_g4~~TRINITY_DN3883_c0_g4_i1.p1  ORF type:complete len:188 (+),score=74.20 TRINITY_DN3883_c0_g4_i1:73-636(+)